jgi:hypothetical protein
MSDSIRSKSIVWVVINSPNGIIDMLMFYLRSIRWVLRPPKYRGQVRHARSQTHRLALLTALVPRMSSQDIPHCPTSHVLREFVDRFLRQFVGEVSFDRT